MKIALVSTAEALGLDQDMPPLCAALEQEGASADVVFWGETNLDWGVYDLVLLRSPWDYVSRYTEFMAWIESVSHITTLLNPFEIVRWNSDKHYLEDLIAKGVPVVPSQFLEPSDIQLLTSGDRAFPWFEDFAEFVIKPTIGAGSRDAKRYAYDQNASHINSRIPRAALEHAIRLLQQNRSVLVQPYLDSVNTNGETAMMFFNGEFSHAIRKGPLLMLDADSTKALFAPEEISSRDPTDVERMLAKQALDALPKQWGQLLYARVDLIKDSAGQPQLLELELTEPSLFFDFKHGAATQFARCVIDRLSANNNVLRN